MALGPLTVSKQVSPCNQLIRVQGQITGARVDIFVNGNNVPAGGGIAHSPDQDFSINSNIILNAEIVSYYNRFMPLYDEYFAKVMEIIHEELMRLYSSIH